MNNETDIEVTSYVEPAPASVPMQLSPLQLQLLDTAAEMGMDTDWFQKEILMDENCLNGLELVTE
jgi:hypothetical protein